jgi:PDZ domain-containing protein
MIYGQREGGRFEPPGTRPVSGRAPSPLRLALFGALLAALVAGSFLVRLPVLTVHPGPTPDVARIIEISGQTYPVRGSLHMTTVTVQPATLVEALMGWFNQDVAVIDREAIYPPGKSEQEIVQQNATEMDESGVKASIAAFRELGLLGPPEGALVTSTRSGTPAAEVLEARDVILTLDGEAVSGIEELQKLVRKHEIGDEVSVGFRRASEEKTVTVNLVDSPDEETKGTPVLGVTGLTKYRQPFDVTIKPGNIGGPSAGLMFALAMVDLLGAEDLTRGLTIAGTGTIDADGKVGAVGGVAQKVAAAERIHARYFLAPREANEAEQARKLVEGDMQVIEVDTLHDAVVALQKLG